MYEFSGDIMKKMRIVVALGGNALGKNLSEQYVAVRETAKAIADLIEYGHDVIVTHGNGPQVGMIQNAMTELTRVDPARYVPCPLSVCVAMSQGYIGYDLHFFSAHDMSEEEDFDPYEQEVFADKLQESPEKITFRNGCTERLQRLFDQLSGKERSILGHTFGVFGYEMLTASEIAVLELMTENGVNKSKRSAIEKLIMLYPDSELQVWMNIWDGLECVRRKWEEK